MIKNIDEKYVEFLRDETRMIGIASHISFPINREETAVLVEHLSQNEIPFTVQGSRTGIAGAAVPMGGHILNLCAMNRIIGIKTSNKGEFLLKVQPGVLLCDFNAGLKKTSFDVTDWEESSKETLTKLIKAEPQFFPPDPTENSATIGGMFSCNARGINGYLYGSTAEYVEEITVNLTSGEIWNLSRGQFLFDKTGCPLPNGKRLTVEYLGNDFPVCKNLIAYQGMDLIDLFAGSEGMLGVVSELTIRLCKKPAEKWGVVFFFSSPTGAVDFTQALWQRERSFDVVKVAAIEYFDKNSLDMVGWLKTRVTKLKEIPEPPKGMKEAVYVELTSDESDSIKAILVEVLELFVECGGDEDATWAASDASEIERFRLLRHSVPESVNTRIDIIRQNDSRITKLGADLSAPRKYLAQNLDMYRDSMTKAGIYGIIFGHIGNNHFHVNLIPEDYSQYQRGQVLIAAWAKEIAGQGGTIATENGVGKVKKQLYLDNVSSRQLRMARAFKDFLDPKGLLNPGNML